jgi:hypothetical protein
MGTNQAGTAKTIHLQIRTAPPQLRYVTMLIRSVAVLYVPTHRAHDVLCFIVASRVCPSHKLLKTIALAHPPSTRTAEMTSAG